MSDHKGLPVAGYVPQSEEKVALVNLNKEIEERLLRHLDQMASMSAGTIDPRWYSVARTHFEQGFMALNRSVFQPTRVTLPED